MKAKYLNNNSIFFVLKKQNKNSLNTMKNNPWLQIFNKKGITWITGNGTTNYGITFP